MTLDRDHRYSPLSRWILDLVESGQFRSIRALALQAKLSQSTLHLVLERGRAEPETLLRLAEVARVPPIDLFVKAGWLKQSDIEGSPGVDLRPDEKALVDLYRRAPEPMRRAVFAALREMAATPSQPGLRPQDRDLPPAQAEPPTGDPESGA